MTNWLKWYSICIIVSQFSDLSVYFVTIFLACSTCMPHADHTFSSCTFTLQTPYVYLAFSMCLLHVLHMLSLHFKHVDYIYILGSLQTSSLASPTVTRTCLTWQRQYILTICTLPKSLLNKHYKLELDFQLLIVLPRLGSTRLWLSSASLAAFITWLAELSYKYGSASGSWAAQSSSSHLFVPKW